MSGPAWYPEAPDPSWIPTPIACADAIPVRLLTRLPPLPILALGQARQPHCPIGSPLAEDCRLASSGDATL